MGHNQDSVHRQVLRILRTGPHTLKGIAQAGGLSTRTVQKHLLGLMRQGWAAREKTP